MLRCGHFRKAHRVLFRFVLLGRDGRLRMEGDLIPGVLMLALAAIVHALIGRWVYRLSLIGHGPAGLGRVGLEVLGLTLIGRSVATLAHVGRELDRLSFIGHGVA